MADRFPDYDVLAKRDTPSWNAQTREAIDARLALPARDDVLTPVQRATLAALIEAIAPEPEGRPRTNTFIVLLDRIGEGKGDGYRHALLPPLAEAWARGLDAIEAEAQAAHSRPFAHLESVERDALLTRIEKGDVASDGWQDLDPTLFWKWRLIPDIVTAHYSHPSAWSAMGFGGPASPRGYVRLDANRRDPWEAAERTDGAVLPASVRNHHVR